ncbi:MAG: ATP-binding cassette domain-containing protein [Alsobacter sp.]
MTQHKRPLGAADDIGAFLGLARSFWTGRRSWSSWGSLAVTGLFVAWQTHAQVALTDWSRRFFDALAARSAADLAGLPAALLPLAAAYVVAVTGMVVSRLLIQWHWRRHVTRSLLDRWFRDNGFLRVETAAAPLAAAESRIVDDVRASVEPLAELGIGLVSNLTSAAAFSVVLASVGGGLVLEIAGRTVTIPVYMLVVTLAYAAIISGITWITGHRLMPLARWRNDAEARLRATLGRVRDNAESVALAGGAESEALRAEGALGRLGTAWYAVIGQNGLLGLTLNLNGALFAAVPLIFAAPKALAGALTIGDIAQLVAAFTAVQGALLWVVDNFVKLADCRAAAARVGTLVLALDRAAPGSGASRPMRIDPSEDVVLAVSGFQPATGQSGHGCGPLTFSLRAGESILVTGPSGIGKTSMLRAVAGLVEPARGACAVAPGVRMAVVPQKPYLPVGVLRDLVCFPRVDRCAAAEVADALARCGLGALRDKLDTEQPWDRSLSMGERQRLAFANLLLRDLDLILLDEATSALDEISQARLMTELRRAKPACAILSIGHRPSLVPLHDRVVTLAPDGSSELPAPARLSGTIAEAEEAQNTDRQARGVPDLEAMAAILRQCVPEDGQFGRIESSLFRPPSASKV